MSTDIHDTIEEQISVAAKTALSKVATDVVSLNVGPLIGITDSFLIFSTANDRQLKSCMEYVEDALRETFNRKPLFYEGDAETGWLIRDYGDYVIHGFTKETRDYYALENLWSDAPVVEFLDEDVTTT